MGRVVRADAVDRAVGQAFAHRLDVLGAAQRRVHLVERVVCGGELFGQEQVVRRGLGRNIDALCLAPTHEVDRARGRQVTHVQARADVLGEQNIAGDDRLFGDGGPTGQAELAGQRRLVHLSALGESGVLAVLGNHAAEALDIFEGAAHEDGIGHALAVVGEDTDLRARTGHRAERCEVLTFQALGNGTDGANLDPVGLLTQAQHLIDDGRRVLRGRRVGHRVHGRVAANRSRARAGKDGLGVLPARLAQVSVNVDEAGQGDEAFCVDDARVVHGVASVGTDRDDGATGQRNVGGLPAEQRGAGDQDVTGLFSHCCVLPMREAGRGRPCGCTHRSTPVRR